MGYCYKFGSNVSANDILPEKYSHVTDYQVLGSHLMEEFMPEFDKKVVKGDLIVADENFGWGGVSDLAARAIKGRGIGCVIARSFGRGFFRSAYNNGVGIIICDEAVDKIDEMDEVLVHFEDGRIFNKTKQETYHMKEYDDIIMRIMYANGITDYVQGNLAMQYFEDDNDSEDNRNYLLEF